MYSMVMCLQILPQESSGGDMNSVGFVLCVVWLHVTTLHKLEYKCVLFCQNEEAKVRVEKSVLSLPLRSVQLWQSGTRPVDDHVLTLYIPKSTQVIYPTPILDVSCFVCRTCMLWDWKHPAKWLESCSPIEEDGNKSTNTAESSSNNIAVVTDLEA